LTLEVDEGLLQSRASTTLKRRPGNVGRGPRRPRTV